jgi:hypothetical protein
MATQSIADGGDQLEEVRECPVCTVTYMETLSSDFEIPFRNVEGAFMGVSMKTAFRVCEWVEEKDIASPRKRGEEETGNEHHVQVV